MAYRFTAMGMPQNKRRENLNFGDHYAGQAWQLDDRGVSDLIRLFAHNPLRVFVATQPGEFRMSEVPSGVHS